MDIADIQAPKFKTRDSQVFITVTHIKVQSINVSEMESDNQAQESVTLGKIPLLDETTKFGTSEKKQRWIEKEEHVAGPSHDNYLTYSEPDLMSTQDNAKQDKWLQEIRDSEGDYEQEVMSDHEADLNTRFNSCTKNPGHEQFIDVNTFRSEHLPEPYQGDQKMTDFVRAQADVTCLIKASYVSPDRPKTLSNYKYRGKRRSSRTGTGCVARVLVYTEEDKGDNYYQPCQCQTCQRSGEPRSEWAELYIITARHVVFDESEAETSKCYFFYDNPQQKLKDCPVVTGGHIEWVDSHSDIDVIHIGYCTHDLVWARKLQDMCDRYNSLCDDLKQKYDPFSHVVPDRVAEDNNDEKNKVPSDKSKDNNPTGHGVQDHVSHGDDCDKEKNDDEENVDNVCKSYDDDDISYNPEHHLSIIVSHPHGYSKMVTLGHLTYRRTKPYLSYEHSTATCPGSSGAPVIILGNGRWLYYNHVHSRRVSGPGPEKINICVVRWLNLYDLLNLHCPCTQTT